MTETCNVEAKSGERPEKCGHLLSCPFHDNCDAMNVTLPDAIIPFCASLNFKLNANKLRQAIN